MKKSVLLLLSVLVPAACGCLEKPSVGTAQTAPWAAFQYRRLKYGPARSANLVLSLPVLPKNDAEVRLLFELQPGNRDYYFVGVTRNRVALGKVECGVELPLAEWTGAGPPAAPFFARARRVTVVRRPGTIEVAVGHRKVIRVCDDTFEQGLAAVGAHGLPAGVRPRVRRDRTSEIYTTDDFMRTGEEDTSWQPVAGDWRLLAPDNPGLSANAFTYAGRAADGRPALALRGSAWWDDYTFEVSARAADADGFGVAFRYVDDANHYLFRYTGGRDGRLQLVRVLDGRATVLEEVPAALKRGQWYRFGVTAQGRRLSARVDGNPACEVRDDAFSFGCVGLYAAGRRGAEFDDVVVLGERGLVEDFADGHLAWYRKGGRWTVVRKGAASLLAAEGPAPGGPLRSGKLLAGEEEWADYRVSATVAPGSSGRAGVVVLYRDEADYTEFAWNIGQKRYELVKVRDGRRRIVAQAPARPGSASRELSVALSRGVVVCSADGKRVLSHFDDTALSGKAGLSVGPGASVCFERVSVTFPRETEPILTHLDTFAAESTMQNWAATKSDWQSLRTAVWDESRRVYWHRAAFPGGGAIRTAVFFSPAEKGSLRLYACCTLFPSRPATRVLEGYELAVTSPGAGKNRGVAELRRNGRVVASTHALELRSRNRVSLRTVADYVIAEVNGKSVLAFRDPKPLRGWSSGYAVEGALVRQEQVEVFCENTRVYSFVRAAAGWRTAGGTWAVTNRWRCDPRWSFFGGENLDGVAAIWNKTKFSGDMTLEFAAGIRHQRRPGGYRHASDMNAVLCGDGSDLASGYGFVYGGWGNSRSAITRNGKIVAQCSRTIPTGGIHRRWWYFKIVKRGGHLRYYVDNVLLLEYDDPNPLPGGQVALWTWKNGLMVARVRIAAERIGPRESWRVPYRDVERYPYRR